MLQFNGEGEANNNPVTAYIDNRIQLRRYLTYNDPCENANATAQPAADFDNDAVDIRLWKEDASACEIVDGASENSLTDNVDGDISANIVIGGDTVDTNTAGQYIVTYNVSDAAGKTSK